MKRILFVLLVLSFSGSLIAQTSQGRILGTVTDKSGATVAGAAVTILNTATGVSRELVSSAAGEYVAPNLESGPYSVTVQAPTFRTEVRSGIVLEVAKDARVDFKLVPGAVTETMTVTGAAPVVDTTNDVLGVTFSNDAINELPLQGRDFQNLVILQPGIQRTPGGGFLSITANGNRPEDNNFIIDGLDDNDAYYGTTVVNAEGVVGTPATHLPIDALSEFNVQTSPEAEYGLKPGAIINLGIKSGTNKLHGSAYYFNRNAAFDARNYFNPSPATISALNLHQYGASLGGPILHDKLFLFGNYEAVRDKVGNPLTVNTPTTVHTGDPKTSLVDAFAECQATNTCSPVSEAVVNLFPTNPGTAIPKNPKVLATDFLNTNREDNGVLKLNYDATPKNTFIGTYFIGDSLQHEEDVIVINPLFISQANTRAQVLGGSWIYAPNGNLTNQARIGYNRFWQTVTTGDQNRSAASFGVNTGVTNPVNFGLPAFRISGFTRLGGSNSFPLYTTPNQTWQFTDNVSYLVGTHTLRFGGEFRTGSTDNTRNTFGKGEIRFSSLEDFAQGNVRQETVFIGDSHRHVSQKSFGLFVQDDWRASKRFTVTAGLRYDVTFPIKERNNLLANFDPKQGLVQVGKQIGEPYNTDYNNFGPRLGLIWDPRGDGRTVVRAGAGVVYEIPHISVFIGQNGANALGLAEIPTGVPGVTPGGGTIVTTTKVLGRSASTRLYNSGGPIFGDLSASSISCTSDPGNQCPILGTVKNLVTPYVINWNFNVQQALWQNSALTIAYVGNKGNKLYSLRDINQNIPANDPNHDEQTGRPFNTQFPYLSFIDILGNGDSSIYHGLQVTLNQRTTHGLFFVAGYTWAHAIDDSSGNRTFDIQNSYDPAAERSNSASDIRNRFTLATTYAAPSREGFAQLLKGWSFNNIVSAQTGTPIFFYDSSNDISGTGEFNDHWNLFGNPSAIHINGKVGLPYFSDGTTNPACVATAGGDPVLLGQLSTFGCYAGPGFVIAPPAPFTFGNFQRNKVYGPGYFNIDASAIKRFTFRERATLELRAEFFNVLNHPNLAGIRHDLSFQDQSVGLAFFTPDVEASNPVVGSGGSRHIQLGAKLIF